MRADDIAEREAADEVRGRGRVVAAERELELRAAVVERHLEQEERPHERAALGGGEHAAARAAVGDGRRDDREAAAREVPNARVDGRRARDAAARRRRGQPAPVRLELGVRERRGRDEQRGARRRGRRGRGRVRRERRRVVAAVARRARRGKGGRRARARGRRTRVTRGGSGRA